MIIMNGKRDQSGVNSGRGRRGLIKEAGVRRRRTLLGGDRGGE